MPKQEQFPPAEPTEFDQDPPHAMGVPSTDFDKAPDTVADEDRPEFENIPTLADKSINPLDGIMARFERKRYLPAMEEDFWGRDLKLAQEHLAVLQQSLPELEAGKISPALENVLRLDSYVTRNGEERAELCRRLYQVVGKLVVAIEPIIEQRKAGKTQPKKEATAPKAAGKSEDKRPKPVRKHDIKPEKFEPKEEKDPVDAMMARFEREEYLTAMKREFSRMKLSDAAEQFAVLQSNLETLKSEGVTPGIIEVLHFDAGKVQALGDEDYERLVDRLGDVVTMLVKDLGPIVAERQKEDDKARASSDMLGRAKAKSEIRLALERLESQPEADIIAEYYHKGPRHLEWLHERVRQLEAHDEVIRGEALDAELKKLGGLTDDQVLLLDGPKDTDEPARRLIAHLKDSIRIIEDALSRRR